MNVNVQERKNMTKTTLAYSHADMHTLLSEFILRNKTYTFVALNSCTLRTMFFEIKVKFKDCSKNTLGQKLLSPLLLMYMLNSTSSKILMLMNLSTKLGIHKEIKKIIILTFCLLLLYFLIQNSIIFY